MPGYEGYEITHNKDGSISFVCSPAEPGTYKISVEHDGVPLTGLPMCCVVQKTADGYVTAYKTGENVDSDFSAERILQEEDGTLYAETKSEDTEVPKEENAASILTVLNEDLVRELPQYEIIQEAPNAENAAASVLWTEQREADGTAQGTEGYSQPEDPANLQQVEDPESHQADLEGHLEAVVLENPDPEDIQDVDMTEHLSKSILAAVESDADEHLASSELPVTITAIKEEADLTASTPVYSMATRRKSSRNIAVPVKFEDFVSQVRPAKSPEKKTTVRRMEVQPVEQPEANSSDAKEVPVVIEPKFLCTVEGCEKAFITKQRLEKHIQTHDNTLFICGVLSCKKQFKLQQTFTDHCQTIHKVSADEWLSRFPCAVKECRIVVDTLEELRKHLDTAHADLKKVMCHLCPKILGSPAKLKEHLETHSEELLFQCDHEDCNLKFRTKRLMDAHRKSHDGKALCFDCGKRFASTGNLNKHVISVHTNPRKRKIPSSGIKTPSLSKNEELTMICDICGKFCKTKPSLKNHIREMHLMEDLKMIDKNELLPYRPFKCDQCNKGFKRQAVFKAHMALHNSTTEYPCTKAGCNKKYPTIYKLNDHIRTVHKHEDEIHFCDYEGCDRAFKRISSLNVHKRKHKNERFVCIDPDCPMTFSTKFCMLSHHKLRHECVEPKFFCQLCNRGFRLKLQLTRHMETHSDNKEHLCGICGKCFKTKSTLQAHSRIHFTEKQYKCDYCSKTFPRKYRLTQHVNATHTTYVPSDMSLDMQNTITELQNTSGKHILIIEQVEIPEDMEL